MQLPLLRLAALLLSSSLLATASPLQTRADSDFVKTDGTSFTLNGKPFPVVGGNAYWVTLADLSDKDIDTTFAEVIGMGGTTVRVWGFNEMIDKYIDGRTIYTQSWSGKNATINHGKTGFGYFDRVIAGAKRNNVRLIFVLTTISNGDYVYGGVQTYVRQILGNDKSEREFFTNPEIKAVFKNYVGEIVTRYKDEPTILSWELGNEIRCAISWGPWTAPCTTQPITSWIEEVSSHIKSIDSNHLVAAGDQGYFNRPGHPKSIYNGQHGVDFDANLALESIDYGTFMYTAGYYDMPTHTNEPVEWIQEHAKSQKAIGKPVLLSRIGPEIRTHWITAALDSGLAGLLYWQMGPDYLDLNMPYWYHGDSLAAIFTSDSTYTRLKRYADDLKRRA